MAMVADPLPPIVPEFLSGGGEMGARMRALDWHASPLGPPVTWPPALRTVVGLMLESRFPMFVAWGPQLAFLYNDGYAPIFGAKHPDALGRPFAEVWSEIWPDVEPLVRRALDGKASFRRNMHLVMERNGFREDTWYTFSYSPVRDDEGRVAGMFCACTETTDVVLARRNADFMLTLETRLRGLSDPGDVVAAAQEMLGRQLGAQRVGYGTADPSGRWFETPGNWTDGSIAPAAGVHDLEVFGPEIVGTLRAGRTLVVHDVGTDPRTAAPDRRAAFAALEMAALVTATLVKDGRLVAALYVHCRSPRRWTPAEVALVEDTAERTWSAMERARAEASRREGDRRLAVILDSVSDGFYALDTDWRFILFNPASERFFGKNRSEVLNRVLWDVFPMARGTEFEARYRGVMAGGPAVRFEVESVACPGRMVEMRAAPMAGGGIAVALTDVTERKRAEAALQDLNATLERRVAERTADRDRMWRLSTDIMVVARFDGTITAVNPAWTTLLGWTETELLGRPIHGWVHPEDMEPTAAEIRRLAAGRITPRFENRYRHRDGSWRWISWMAVPDDRFIHAVGRDVTAERHADAALKEVEGRLLQAQKLEAVGQLTGGIAHDFNNLLQAMAGCLTMIGRRSAEPSVQVMLQAGQQAVDRGAKLVQQLMAFARPGALRPESIDIRDRILAMRELLSRTLRADIAMETSFAPDLRPVRADPTQFDLAILNLAANARDAMPGGGVLRIGALCRPALPEDAALGLTGDIMELWVEDSGHGMPPEVLTRAFEPFFTTKEVGRGSGLGLAQVYGLARQAGGTARVDSTPGHGTRVTLLLPPAADPAAADRRAETEHADGFRGKGRRVLVVEDDPVVASTVAAALEDTGCRVVRVPTADDALPLLAGGAQIDLLFSDVIMPGRLSGVDLVREARRLRPGLPVLLTTGYSERTVAAVADVQVLAKPYRLDDLTAAIAKALPEEG